MSKNHISVSPQILTNYLTILFHKNNILIINHLMTLFTIVNVWSCDLSGIPLTKVLPQSVNHLPSAEWPRNTMLQSDWLILNIEYNFFTGGLSTLGQHQTAGQKAVGPMLAANIRAPDVLTLGQHWPNVGMHFFLKL